MPLALLLSPDDQAVSAITAVLEEMSVTCERPLDGVSAAQKINSNNFDLVLVDCENLPAAKLIFDVCRRGKGGNLVPIAIVDGRAGLPTAFRLGAELVLTKPVAKDQARSTIRTAVSRVKKEDPAGTADRSNAAQTDALQTDAGQGNQKASIESAGQAMPEERALAASAAAESPQLTSFSDPAPVAALCAPAVEATMTTATSAPAAAPEVSAVPTAKATSAAAELKPSVPHEPSDDPVLRELEQTEAEAEAKPQPPMFSSYQESPGKRGQSKEGDSEKGQSKQKTRGPLVAVLVLLLACAGFYAAWMYEPGFQALARPQIDRVLALAGVAHSPQRPAPTPVRLAAQPTKVTVPADSGDSAQSSQLPATNASAAATTISTTTGAPPAAVPLSATTSSAHPASATAATEVAWAATGVTASPAGKQTNAESKGTAVAGPGDSELPGEKTALILSSTGAAKRLMHSVQPTYPAGVRPGEAEGTMVLKAVVDENGTVAGARVVEGNAALANAAISAVKQWRYRPYVRDGKALPFQTVVLVDFKRP